MAGQVCGEVTKTLHSVWSEFVRRGNGGFVESAMIPALFHKLGLFPSNSQIHEMLQCASDCANRPSAEYLSFGEFCVFSTELKTAYENKSPRPQPLSKMPEQSCARGKHLKRDLSKNSLKYEVFLGGSCNPTTWRQNLAIPLLKKWGITFYNPQVGHWKPELIELENQAKQIAEVLFFIIDNQTRSIASIIEASHISGCQRKLILVIKRFHCPGQIVLGEPLSANEFEDLCHGQAILQDLVERQGIPVFDDIRAALECTARLVREGLWPQDLTLDDRAQPVRKAHVLLGDKLIKMREAFNALDTNNTGFLGLNDVKMAFRILTNYDLSMEDLEAEFRTRLERQSKDEFGIDSDDITVTFEQFCCIVSEYKHKRTAGRCILRSMVFKTANILHSLLMPLIRIIEWVLPHRRMRLASHQHDVFLGGSCSLTTWREELAIPLLRKNGLTYFNPQTNSWQERFIPIEATAMENCRLLLFVVTNSSRSLAAMAIAAHYIGLGCNVVLCIQYLQDDCVINSEKLSQQSIKDYNRGRAYLSDLANRANVRVFDEINEALECVVEKCKSNS